MRHGDDRRTVSRHGTRRGQSARVIACILMIAGAVGLVGSIGPWARVRDGSGENRTTIIYGLSSYNDAGGKVTGALMVVVCVLAVVKLVSRTLEIWAAAGVCVAAVLAGLVAFVAGGDLADGAGAGVTAGSIDVAWGVRLVGIAAVVVLAAVLCDSIASARRAGPRSMHNP